jgi:AraC-like DNA-binding protein
VIAERSGLRTAALLNAAFRRELGMPPGAYRRLASGAVGESDE